MKRKMNQTVGGGAGNPNASSGGTGQTMVTKSQLQLFTKPSEESCIEDSHALVLHPIAPLSNEGPVEFVVQPSERYYLDLYNTCVRLAVKVTLANGTDPAPVTPAMYQTTASKKTADSAGSATETTSGSPTPSPAAPIPINNWAHSIFSSCALELGNVQVGISHNLYPFTSYILNAINMPAAAKAAHLTTPVLYLEDFVQGADPTTTPSVIEAGQNYALYTRAQRVERGKTTSLYMKPFCDFFQQPLYLLSNCGMRLVLRRAPPQFALCCFNKNKSFKIEIVSASLELRRISLADRAAREIEASLARGLRASYSFTTMDPRHFEIATGQHNYTGNIYTGAIPQRVFMFLVPSEAFLGSYGTNPLIFWNYFVNYVDFLIDNVSVRAKPLLTNFDVSTPGGADYLDAYRSLFEMSRTLYTNMSMDISYADYARKLCLFGLDVTADQSADAPSKRGVFSIDIRFAKATPMALKGVVVGEFKSLVNIDRERQVEFTIL